MAHEPARILQLSLLQGFDLTINQQRVSLTWSVQRLLAFLALRERPLSRPYVAGMLWSDMRSERANANLRSALWRAQRPERRLIAASSQTIALGQQVRVDVRAAIRRAHHLLDATVPADEADLNPKTRLALSADLLPDWYDDDWVVVERERFRQLRLHALEVLCEQLTAIGRFGEAVDAGLAAVRAEPLRESAHRALVRVYLAEGNQSEAVRQYVLCRRLLREELGIEPSPSFRGLLPAPRNVS
jgi:DNA-binding SARP family transcriptional activator